MKLSLFFKGMFFVTLMALIYINMQMQIIDLAYQGKKKEKKIQALLEENGNLSFDIFKLESASHIGRQLLEDSGLTFASDEEVIEVEAPEMRQSSIDLSALTDKNKRDDLINRFLNLVATPAEAKQR